MAVVRTTPQRVLEDYARVLELSGCGALLRDARNVVAYGNLTWSRYFPGGSSPPWQLDGVAQLARGKSNWRWVAGLVIPAGRGAARVTRAGRPRWHGMARPLSRWHAPRFCATQRESA